MPDLPFKRELPFKLPDPNFRPPDIVGTVEGWRVWRLTYNPREFESPRLYSATFSGYYWHPRKFAEATCTYCNEGPPGEECSCGFYSAKSLEHLMTMSYHQYDLDAQPRGEAQVMVLGRIANWGKVIECVQGWRSQFAYPVQLWLPFEAAHLVPKLKEAYGVPVSLKNILNAGKGARSPYRSPNPHGR